MLTAILKEAWISIASYKLRTFLTMLGIMIGVAAVVMMVSAGQAVQNRITETFASMGSNLILIGPAELVTGGVRGGRGLPSVTVADVAALKSLKDVEATSYLMNAAVQAVYGSSNYGVSVKGTNPEYLIVNNWEIEDGVMFTEKDVRAAKPYAVIGQTVVDELFGLQNPLGKTIRLKGKPFTVIGTLKEKGDGLMGDDQDNIILMPSTTVRQRLAGSPRPQYTGIAFVKATSEDKMELVAKRVEYMLRTRHRLKDGVKNDFTVRLMTEMVEKVRSVGFVLSALLAAIASISLIVGSIGIMNMMLVSVTERTREIGTRKALGAPNSWIMMQFLAESAIIACIGGLIGITIGVALAYAVCSIPTLGFTPGIKLSTILLATVFSSGIGIVFGVYPARKAAKLSPIEALRRN